MICSTSSSSRRTLAALATALALGACAGPRGPGGRGAEGVSRIALFPVDNRSGAGAPLRELAAAAERALAKHGFEVVSGDAVERFLARHRVRYTGALEPQVGRAIREELGVEAVLVTTLERWVAGEAPALSLTMRLVSAADEPAVLWIDGRGRTGGEAPGLLGLGLIRAIEPIRAELLAELARSAARAVRGGRAAPPCDAGGAFALREHYRAPRLSEERSPRIAILPFLNRSSDPSAGELVALAVVRALAAVDRFRVLEPGVVRDLALRYRLILEGGVTVHQARTMLGALEVDLVVTGDVFEYADGGAPGGTRVSFSLTAIDGRTGRVVWQSSSHGRGDDGRTVFELGNVATAHELACRMLRNVADGMASGRR